MQFICQQQNLQKQKIRTNKQSNKNRMTLLSRNPRSKSTTQNQSQNPGPGYYQSSQNCSKHGSAPFGSTSKRFNLNRNISQQSNPFPGKYANHRNIASQKIIMHMEAGQQKIAIVQFPKPSSNFKSKTIRFQNSINIVNPGPGSYFGFGSNKKSIMKANKKIKTNALKKYIQNFRQQQDEMFKEQKFQSSYAKIPRYNQLKNTNASANTNIPTYYPHKVHPQHFFSSSVPRIKQQRPQTSIGPGEYEVNKVTVERNIVVNKILKEDNRKKKQQQEHHPQPGFYYNQEFMSAFSNKKRFSLGVRCFGTTANRFSDDKKYDQQKLLPGPGYYDFAGNSCRKTPKTKKDSKNRKTIGFGSTQKRDKSFENNAGCGDGDFDLIIQSTQKNEKNPILFNNEHKSIKSKPQVSFGSKATRFTSLNHQNNNDLAIQSNEIDLKPNQNEQNLMFASNQLEQKRKGLNFNTRFKGSTVPRQKEKQQEQNRNTKNNRKQGNNSITPICYDTFCRSIQKFNKPNQQLTKSFKSNVHQKFTLFLSRNAKLNDQQKNRKCKRTKTHTNSNNHSFEKNKQSINLLRVKTQSTSTNKYFKKKLLGDDKIENILKIKYNSQLMKQKKNKQNWSHQPRDPFKPKDKLSVCPGYYNAQNIGKKSFHKLCLR